MCEVRKNLEKAPFSLLFEFELLFIFLECLEALRALDIGTALMTFHQPVLVSLSTAWHRTDPGLSSVIFIEMCLKMIFCGKLLAALLALELFIMLS